MIDELQNRLQGLEWNAANAVQNLQAGLELLKNDSRKIQSRLDEVALWRREVDRHLAALVEFKRSHTM